MALLVTLLVALLYALLLWALGTWVGSLPLVGRPSFVQALLIVVTARVLIIEDWLGFRAAIAALLER